MIIKTDLDGVFADIMGVLREALLDLSGGKYGGDVMQIPFYGIHKSSIPRELVLDALDIVYERWRDVPIDYDARAFFMAVYKETKEPIHVITARPVDCMEDTYLLCDRFFKISGHRIPYSLSSASGDRKWKYCRNADFMIEDRRKTALELAYEGIYVFLLRRPWNQPCEAHPLITEVDTFHEIADITGFSRFLKDHRWRNQTYPFKLPKSFKRSCFS